MYGHGRNRQILNHQISRFYSSLEHQKHDQKTPSSEIGPKSAGCSETPPTRDWIA